MEPTLSGLSSQALFDTPAAEEVTARSGGAAPPLPKRRMPGDRQKGPAPSMVAEPARAADPATASTAPIDVSEGIHEQKPPSPPVGDDAAVSLPTTTTPSVSDSICFDCESELSDPWTSVTYGITLCLSCAGAHRSLGVHMSFVRSLTLDTLSESEQRALALGGNGAFADFLADPARGVSRKVWLSLPMETRYFTPAADLYKRQLQAKRDAQPTQTPRGDDLPREIDPHVRPPAPSAAHGALSPPRWTADRDAPKCELCKANFGIFNWRHHCRMCGRCICAECSPIASWRPLPEFLALTGNAEPQRNCKLCVTPTRPMPGMPGA